MQAELKSDSETDKTPLVYVPGIDGTGELLLGTAARLAEEFRLVELCYTHAGEELRDDAYGALGRSVAECVRARGIERALFLADSFGVSLALRTALDHPELVAGLALVNGFAHYPSRLRIALSRVTAPLVPRFLFDFGRATLAPLSLFAPRRDPAAVRAFRALPGGFFDAGYQQRLTMVRSVDLRPRLAEIRQPVAIYAADHDRVVPAVAAARVLEAGLADCTCEILPDTGHLVLPLAEEPWVERMQALAERAGLAGEATRGTSRAS